MKSVLPIIMVTALAVLGISCGGGDGSSASPSSGSTAPPQVTWIGTGEDSNETNVNNSTPIATTIVTWTLTQTGASVSGTVTTLSTDSPNTTCNSCHRTKTGTLSGTIDGTTLTWTASFPGGDLTPICTATLTGTVSGITETSLSGVYTGEDFCEGQFLNGTLTLARQP